MPAACAALAVSGGLIAAAAPARADAPPPADLGRVPAGGVLRVSVPEAFGGKTVIGQLTVGRALERGYVTAYGCDDGLPLDPAGGVVRSDLNFDGRVSPVASNRLVVEADDDGDVCFYTSARAALVVDVNAVTFDTGVTSFPNRRTDTRSDGSHDPTGVVPGGEVLRVAVPEAVGGKTVVGQLTAARATGRGFVTAYGCDGGVPLHVAGGGSEIGRSDLNVDSAVSRIASNRLIVRADDDGDVCFLTSESAALVVDVNGVSERGITSFTNRRTDTRHRVGSEIVPAGDVLRIRVPEAAGRRTVIGQLTAARATERGYVTAYGCDDGPPSDGGGGIARSDLNVEGAASPVASNRLVVQADLDGDVCFLTSSPVALVVDVNGVAAAGISSFANRRVDTRLGDGGTVYASPAAETVAPEWEPYEPRPAVAGVAALTGLPAPAAVRERPIVAVKIDNYGPARPQWGLQRADAVFELNVEGISRFVALFHSDLPDVAGPVRSARTADLDLVTAMNRPVFAYSGANPGVVAWIGSAASAGVLVDAGAQRVGCYARTAERPGPHNLLLDLPCALAAATPSAPGPASALWAIDDAWTPSGLGTSALTSFTVDMDGVEVGWTWDPVAGVYLRSQDGVPHLGIDEEGTETRLGAANVLVLAVEHAPSPVDARSPHPVTVGSGVGVLHRDGRAIPVRWSRAGSDDPFEFVHTGSGAAVPLAAGRTFVELSRSP